MRPIKLNDFSGFNPQPKPTPKLKEPKKPIGKKPVHSFSQLRDEADKVWSEYIRQYYADQKGEVKCFTCTNKSHWKQMHCGHFVSREQNSVRFDFRNCHPQCPECNVVKRGNLDEYEKQIDILHGQRTAQNLKELARKPFKLDRERLEFIISNYKIFRK